MLKGLLCFSILFSMNCDSQPHLPNEMPDDLNIILYQHSDENQRNSISITSENLQIESGSGWHNRAKKKYRVKREEVEKLYRVLIENQFDKIQPESDVGENQLDRNDLSVFWDKKSVSVYSGSLTYSYKNMQTISLIQKAILDFVEVNKTQEIKD